MNVTPSKLKAKDIWRVGASGPRARISRTLLSALGVSIGVAALVGVLGLSESSKSALLDEISALGTDLLTVEAGQGIGAGDGLLPATSPDSIKRANDVESASAVWDVDTYVVKNEFIPEEQTGGISVIAAEETLLDTLKGEVAVGQFVDDDNSYPSVVLGSVAAERLGIRNLEASPKVYVDSQYLDVQGILEEFPLEPDLDRSVILGVNAAESHFDSDESPSIIYTEIVEGQVDNVRELIPQTVNPDNPEEVQVSRPSDALVAQAAADDTLTTLFIGLGAVALLVGGVGIANVMVIAVVERRGEIGLRRALGATQDHIMKQFLTEAVILSGLGGIAGVVIGVSSTYIYSGIQNWRPIIPLEVVFGGLASAIVIGAIAGMYPALRASKLPPTEALR